MLVQSPLSQPHCVLEEVGLEAHRGTLSRHTPCDHEPSCFLETRLLYYVALAVLEFIL